MALPTEPTEGDAKLIANERVKLRAAALNTAATSCFTVGLLTPFAALIYNLGGARSAIPLGSLALGLTTYFGAAVMLHLTANRLLRRLRA